MNIKYIAVQFLVISFLFCSRSLLFAQTDSTHAFSAELNVDLVSRYIWRGQEYGQSPSIQPGMSASWNNFTLGAWGAYKVAGAGQQETDIYLSKSFRHLTVSVWDYWSFCDTSSMNVFDYHPKTTSHQLEAQVLLSGGECLPFNILASCFFYGVDTSNSMYFELQYLHSFTQADMTIFTGYQPKGKFYATKPAFVNLGCTISKSIAVTDRWSLPMSISFIVNPGSKSAWIVAGITI